MRKKNIFKFLLEDEEEELGGGSDDLESSDMDLEGLGDDEGDDSLDLEGLDDESDSLDLDADGDESLDMDMDSVGDVSDDEIEIDVTEIVNQIETLQSEISSQISSELTTRLDSITSEVKSQIQSLSSNLKQLEDNIYKEFISRIPSPEEYQQLHLASSFPDNVRPEEYFKNNVGNSAQFNGFKSKLDDFRQPLPTDNIFDNDDEFIEDEEEVKVMTVADILNDYDESAVKRSL